MSRVVWECNSNIGFSWILKLNIEETPIAYKYCEGTVKSTLKKEWKEHEIAVRGTWFDLFSAHCGFIINSEWWTNLRIIATHEINLVFDTICKLVKL